jgi:diaminopimelate decarboxylase
MNIYEFAANKPTPSYIFDGNIIRNNYIKFKSIFNNFSVYYSLKANSEEPILKMLSEYVDGVEVANAEEFYLAQKAGFESNRIICSAPVKSIECISTMYQHGCRYFVFDTDIEYRKILNYASESKKIMRIYIADLKNDCIKFGMDYTYAIQYLPDGFTIHISNHDLDFIESILNRIDCAINSVYSKILQIGKDSNFIINLGGSYLLNFSHVYYLKILNWCKFIKNKYNKLNFTWIIEPGGGVVESSGYFTCRVENIKKIKNYNYVYINGGIPEGFILKHGKMRNLTSDKIDKKRNIYIFFDTTCLHKQLFIIADKQHVNYMDVLLFDKCGAYTTCYINRFHAKQHPHFYYFNGDEVQL